jgi:hypothetical protein
MSRLSSGSIPLAVAFLTAMGLIPEAPRLMAEQAASVPNFSSAYTAWISANTDFIPIPGSPRPTRNDPAHPHGDNGAGAQPTHPRRRLHQS